MRTGREQITKVLDVLNAGLFLVGALATWGIWSEVVPALGILDQVSLWSQTTMIDGDDAIDVPTIGFGGSRRVPRHLLAGIIELLAQIRK